MSAIRHLVQKALAASRQEWRWRAGQALFGARNALAPVLGSALSSRGHTRSLAVDAASLTAWWRTRPRRWFLGSTRIERLRSAFARGALDEVIRRADLLCRQEMSLFSLPPVSFAAENRWWRDPHSGRVAPRRVYVRVPYLAPELVGDNKLVWEPNRWAWGLWLGLAHVVTGKDQYRETFFDLANDWFDRNPYPYGINYCSALEVAFRAYAWLWSTALFRPALEHDGTTLDRLVQGIWVACRHVERNLSYYYSPNTHLSGEAFSLFACGAAFPEFAEAPRWRRLGEGVLDTEAARQFYRDGTHRELSSGYQLYSTDFYLQACLIGEETGYPVAEGLHANARRFCQRLAELAPEDLVLPQFNDCDGGRLLNLGERQLDAAPTLSAAASLWEGWAVPARAAEPSGYALLMAPQQPQRRSAGTQALEGRRDSGIEVYRNPQGDFLLFRATAFGYMGCPHSHDAPLSFVLYLGGQPVVVDGGVGAYTRDMETRDEFRCARGKNVLLVNERGPSEPGSWFDWERVTNASLISSETTPNGFRCRGGHDGFSALLGFPVLIEREIDASEDGQVRIVDRWEADSPIAPSLWLTLAPGFSVDLPRARLRSRDGAEIRFGHDGDPHSPKVSVAPTRFSPDYGRIEESCALVASVEASRSGSMTTWLSRGSALGAPIGDGGEI